MAKVLKVRSDGRPSPKAAPRVIAVEGSRWGGPASKMTPDQREAAIERVSARIR